MNRQILNRVDYDIVCETSGNSYRLFPDKKIITSDRSSKITDTSTPINMNLYKLYKHFQGRDFEIRFLYGNKALFSILRKDFDDSYDFGMLLGINSAGKLYNEYQVVFNEDVIKIYCNNGNHKILIIENAFNDWFHTNKMVIIKNEIEHYQVVVENFNPNIYEKIDSNLIKECDFIYSAKGKILSM